jgi:hypothetical protein
MDQAISDETGHSSNMADLPTRRKERVVAHILETKFHIEIAADSGLDVNLNPIMRDLFINRRAAKRNRENDRRKKS